MKKIIPLLLLFIALCFIFSCAAPGKKTDSKNAYVILSGSENNPIKMFRTREMPGKPFSTPDSGTKAEILRNFCPEAALIRTPDGKTGWINCGHIKQLP